MVTRSVQLLAHRYPFTQDNLLDPEDFIRGAQERGHDLDLDALRLLHEHRLLTPLFRVGGTGDRGTVVEHDQEYPVSSTVLACALDAAAQGRLYDPWFDGDGDVQIDRVRWERIEDEGWHTFLYSSWQLLDLEDLRPVLSRIGTTTDDGQDYLTWFAGVGGIHQQAEQRRERSLALCALSARYMGPITGRVSLPGGSDFEMFKRNMAIDPAVLLERVDYDVANLGSTAEHLLASAHMADPCANLIGLIRHLPGAWMSLRGVALACMWQRIGAEVLLRCHEDLAEAGTLEALPDFNGVRAWHPLADRLNVQAPNAESLLSVLASLEASPYPSVVLLVEGESEMEQFPLLLKLMGLDRPTAVALQNAHGTTQNPTLLARYIVTPRIGVDMRSGWLLERPATVLFIVMDPEGNWSPEKRSQSERGIRTAVREEVEAQQAQIDDDTLNHLIRVRTWADYTPTPLTYELANFTDDELVPVLTVLATRHELGEPGSPEWEKEVRQRLEAARAAEPGKITEVVGKLGIGKTALARELWPVLEAKFEREAATGTFETPIFQVMREIYEAVLRNPRGRTMLPLPRETPEA